MRDRVRVAEALLQWAEKTHGNEFGHDHHCPLSAIDYRQAWVHQHTPDEVKRCTCGWAAFRQVYDAAQREPSTEG